MIEACIEGHIEIIKLMIKKGADNFEQCLSISCTIKKQNQVKLMIDSGATYCFGCDNKKHPELA